MNNNSLKSDIMENKVKINPILLATMREASKKIAPVWSLENFVAVNPYMGLINQSFENVAQDLAKAGGIQMTLPISFYLEKFNEGFISTEDIESVLSQKSSEFSKSANGFIKSLEQIKDINEELAPILTVADIASHLTGKDWNRFINSRITDWAASYFDKGQAIWNTANREVGIFEAWKSEAEVDFTTEISGLKGFRKHIKQLPNDALEAAQIALENLGLSDSELPLYFHRLLLKQGGWSAYAARLDWEMELYGEKDGKLIEFLSILISWEANLLESVTHSDIRKRWNEAKIVISRTSQEKNINKELAQKLILQEAFDMAAQRKLINKFHDNREAKKENITNKLAQAIFCIDVRSEVYRRNLELVDEKFETLGFAGFFAFPIKYIPIGHESGAAQCPVLLKTGPTIIEEIPNRESHQKAVKTRILNHQVKQIWKSFKSGAISCFSFVSPMGLSYLPKLFTDSFGLTRPVPHPDKTGLKNELYNSKSISLEVSEHNNETAGIPFDQRVIMAKNALNAMSLTENFAKYVLIVGHGSTSVNNPHATGLDCGACGGHSGEANARVAAAVLNDKGVRVSLKEEGINIPDETIFLASLHDTTTDEVRILNENEVPKSQQKELEILKSSLEKAGHTSLLERSLRMQTKGDIDKNIIHRSKDWSQIRPEWGLAGCSAFVVAPRGRTKNIDFGGRSFLHSYEWKKDQGFSILELIMTAPMVVTSWISLQYYASTVDNKNFGSGNKTLHNVTAGLGVLEGYSGDLRVGLPMQSVHDGENFQHEPIKLNVIIEAPIEAMNEILAKHQSVKDLCDNEWIHLLSMNEEGKVSNRYVGDMNWEEIE